jgi:membrane protein DedA with SNARE-associated domain
MTSLAHTFEALIAQYGVAALFVTITLETLGAPLPGESALIIAAGAATSGELDIRAVAIAAFLAAVLGDNIGYLIGRHLGRDAVMRIGSHVGITENAMRKAEDVTARYGAFMVIFARFVVILRQLNGIVAGTTRMPWPHFFAANLVGAALWVGIWTILPYHFGHKIDIVPLIWHHLALVAAILVPLLVLGFVLVHLRHRRRRS